MGVAVDDLIEEQFPGLQLASPIQGWAFLDRFDDGLECFAGMPKASPADLRWAGVCHFSTFSDERAIDLYKQAIARGEMAAHINLAHSLAFVDRADEVYSELEQVNFQQLSPYDRVLYLRVKSLHDERNGNLQLALNQVENAWRLIQGIPEFPLLAPRLLNQLGILHGRIGRAQRALWYLDRNLEISSGDEEIRVKLTRVRVLIALGHYPDADRELAELGDVPDQYQPLMYIRRAEIAWASGSLDRATALYLGAISAAQPHSLVFEEFQAQIDVATILGFQQRFEESKRHLRRAQELVSDRSDRLLFRFREILIHAWQGEYTHPHTLAELVEVAEAFSAMGLLQEQGWVLIHIAHLRQQLNTAAQPREQLDSLQALAVTLQNDAFLDREWTLLATFREVVSKSHPSLVTGRQDGAGTFAVNG